MPRPNDLGASAELNADFVYFDDRAVGEIDIELLKQTVPNGAVDEGFGKMRTFEVAQGGELPTFLPKSFYKLKQSTLCEWINFHKREVTLGHESSGFENTRSFGRMRAETVSKCADVQRVAQDFETKTSRVTLRGECAGNAKGKRKGILHKPAWLGKEWVP